MPSEAEASHWCDCARRVSVLPETKTATNIGRRSRCWGGCKSECELQRHLNLPWSANGLVHDPQATERRGRIEFRTIRREIVEEEVLGNVVDGNVEAGRVGQVEDVEAVLQ